MVNFLIWAGNDLSEFLRTWLENANKKGYPPNFNFNYALYYEDMYLTFLGHFLSENVMKKLLL